MNSFNPQTFKKLLFVFASSILIILIFLVLKMFFLEEKELELKSFNTKKSDSITLVKDTNDSQPQKKFMLLPAK